MSKNDLDKLNSEYNKLLTKCAYQALNNYLLENHKLKGSIKVKPETYSGLVSVNDKGDLTFYGSYYIDATRMAHEWIHLCQEAFRPGSIADATCQGNMEFEGFILRDVFSRMRIGLDYSDDETIWTNNLDGYDDVQKGRMLQRYEGWLDSAFLGKSNITPDEFRRRYEFFADIFFEYHRGYKNLQYSYNRSYGTGSLMDLANLVKSHCLK